MKTDEFDYKNNDKFSLYVKKEKVQEIINYYLNFGWSLYDEIDDDRYEDLKVITLVRPHKINNKDELQFLQVHIEENLNKLGKLERNKNSKITALGLIMGLLSIALISIGIYVCIRNKTIVNFNIGICLCIFGLLLLILELVILPKFVSREIKKYEIKHKELNDEIKSICAKAKLLFEDKNEQDKCER